jgi:hypothetical protein
MKNKTSLAAVALLTLFIMARASDAGAFSGEVFEITGSAKLLHFEAVTPGVKPPVTNVNTTLIIACIMGLDPSCTASALETDPGGKAYLYLDSPTSWRIATNPNCLNATTLAGVVGGDGTFMMGGNHAKSDTTFILQGKLSFVRGTLTPAGIKNSSLSAVSDDHAHFGIGKFSTVGASLGTCP